MIGIVGAFGSVGLATMDALQKLAAGPIRAGYMRTRIDSHAYATCPVDLFDSGSLNRFIRDCDIVINCAGPAHLVRDRIGLACQAQKVGYVDVSGDAALLESLSAGNATTPSLVGAGLQPGLTGLLPRWAAIQHGAHVDFMKAFFGVRDRFTPTSAQDYLSAIEDDDGLSRAAWRCGLKRGVLSRLSEIELPLFPSPITAAPYLSDEIQALATELGIDHMDWYNVFPGSHTLSAMDRAGSQPRTQAIAALCRASELDINGLPPFVALLVELQSHRTGTAPTPHTLLMRGRSNAQLSGALAAATSVAVINAEVPPGCHFAAMALHPDTTIQRLIQIGAFEALELVEGSVASSTAAEEGCL